MPAAVAVKEPAGSTIESLALRAQSGERECFEEIVRRMQPQLEGFLTRRARGADVEDLVQETFVRALDNLGSYDARYRFSTWLYTIASNLAVTQHRRERPRGGDVEQLPDAGESAELHLVRARGRERGARLWQRASELLAPAHYQALWMRYAEDLTVREIAERTGRSAVHVRVLLYRARRRLARELGEIDPTAEGAPRGGPLVGEVE